MRDALACGVPSLSWMLVLIARAGRLTPSRGRHGCRSSADFMRNSSRVCSEPSRRKPECFPDRANQLFLPLSEPTIGAEAPDEVGFGFLCHGFDGGLAAQPSQITEGGDDLR
jgi:hypothetical protein